MGFGKRARAGPVNLAFGPSVAIGLLQIAMTLPMRLTRSQITFSFDPATLPVVEVESGDVVAFETCDDAYARLARGEPYDDVAKALNPVTGPVAVRGAVPGDAISVELVSIEVQRAWVAWVPGLGGLGDKTTSLEVREAPIVGHSLALSDRLSVAVDPMVGCIGVAPKKGIGSTVAPAGRWGGNMDLRELRAGTTIYLPVYHAGGLLALGDVHAAMGTGEPCCMAVEASAVVVTRITLHRGRRLESPRLRMPGATACVGIGNKMTQAQVNAIDQAYDVLVTEFGLSPSEAYAYAAACLELRFGGPASPIALAYFDDPSSRGAGPN